jgi:hypothetical protein
VSAEAAVDPSYDVALPGPKPKPLPNPGTIDFAAEALEPPDHSMPSMKIGDLDTSDWFNAGSLTKIDI